MPWDMALEEDDVVILDDDAAAAAAGGGILCDLELIRSRVSNEDDLAPPNIVWIEG